MNLLITLYHHFNCKYCNLLEYRKTIKLLLIMYFVTFQILILSGSIITTLPDHLPQSFLISDFFSNSPPSKYSIMTHDWKNFSNQEFLEDFNKINLGLEFTNK